MQVVQKVITPKQKEDNIGKNFNYVLRIINQRSKQVQQILKLRNNLKRVDFTQTLGPAN